MVEVSIRENESFESLLRRFQRAVHNERVIPEFKKHMFYVKPGEGRRLKQWEARKRAAKQRRQALWGRSPAK